MTGVLPCLALNGAAATDAPPQVGQGRTGRVRKPMRQNKSREIMHQLLSQAKQTQLWRI